MEKLENLETTTTGGGKGCYWEDCFANEEDKCTLLNKSYKDRECPFYKPKAKEDSDIITFQYANRRIETLNKQITELDNTINELTQITKKITNSTKEELRKKQKALQEAEKEREKAVQRILKRRKEAEERKEHNNV